MAALVNALDNTCKQVGEKCHAEYGWSTNIREKILQLSFQITRTDDKGIKSLEKILRSLLTSLNHILVHSDVKSEKEIARGYLSMLYRMIGHTRDIVDGKGECTLTYMMICVWDEFYPELAKHALKCLVKFDQGHQYGSWKDIKYFCEYYKNQLCACCTKSFDNCCETTCTCNCCNNTNTKSECCSEHNIIHYAVSLINTQLKEDYDSLNSGSNANISLAAKWTPREKSKFGWLYKALATNYFKQYIFSAKSADKLDSAILKCKTDFRKVISMLNRYIDTVQIKQCGQSWSSIDFNNVTSITLNKQKKAFLNIKKNGTVRYSDIKDRIQCADNFTAHIQEAVNGSTEIKGKRVGMADFTKQALSVTSQDEIDLLNSQWRDNSLQTGALGKMIPMVDVSGSMEGDPMDVAIALGIRIAEKSIIGKRVMTFSAKPVWVNLEPYEDFVSQVRAIRKAQWGMNTDFHAALSIILDSIIQNKMTPEDVQDMMLVILSDMQIDQADTHSLVLYENIEYKYAQAGIRVHGRPYKPPHILFWNLRSTSGFPSLYNQPNATMMSGFSPSLLNLFCEKGLESLQSCSPWSLLEQALNNDRYKIMDDKINEIFVV